MKRVFITGQILTSGIASFFLIPWHLYIDFQSFANFSWVIWVTHSRSQEEKSSEKHMINDVLINAVMPQDERIVKLNHIAIQQMQVLEGNCDRKPLK